MPTLRNVFLLLALLLLGACVAPSGDEEPDPDPLPTLEACPDTIVIEDMAFQPGACQVEVGATITFINEDLQPHDATTDTGAVAAFSTGTLERGDSADVTFSEAGDYPYYCTIHPDMIGRIIAK
jgi:plastocyanin